MKSVDINGAVIKVERAGKRTSDNREVFRWIAELPEEEEIYFDQDLKSGCGASPSDTEMLETLLAFLGAAAESYRYDGMEGENSHLFPEPVVKWASENSDDISLVQGELEEELEIERENKKHAEAMRQVAYSWHGGQDSALYAFASSGICEEKGELFSALEDCLVLANEEEKEEVVQLMNFADGLPFDTELDAWLAPWYNDWQGE